MTENPDLAARLYAEAAALMPRRRALLTASVALGSTTTAQAARRALGDWDGPDEIRQAAIAIIDALSEATP